MFATGYLEEFGMTKPTMDESGCGGTPAERLTPMSAAELEMVRGGAEPVGRGLAVGAQAGVAAGAAGVAGTAQALGSAISKGK